MILGDSSLLENMLWDQGDPNTFDLLVNRQVGDVEFLPLNSGTEIREASLLMRVVCVSCSRLRVHGKSRACTIIHHRGRLDMRDTSSLHDRVIKYMRSGYRYCTDSCVVL